MFKSLSGFQKFQPGSDLWFLFYEPDRKLFQEINWRTGFFLESFKSQGGFSQPVLLDTYKNFPNRALLCLPLNKTSWPLDIYKHWKSLKKPSLRVFIPLGGNEEKLDQEWPQADLLCNLSYYVEKNK